MPYRVTWTANIGLIDDLSAYLDRFTDTVQEQAQDVYRGIEQPLLDELQYYPSPPDYPAGSFPWKSERQRRFVLALLRRMAIERGDYVEGPHGGIVVTDMRYQRTFGLRDAWQLGIEDEGGQIRITVANTAENERGDSIAQFVVGSLNQRSRREAATPQQPFHAGRWPLAVDTVNYWFDVFAEDLIGELEQQFDDYLKTSIERRSRR